MAIEKIFIRLIILSNYFNLVDLYNEPIKNAAFFQIFEELLLNFNYVTFVLIVFRCARFARTWRVAGTSGWRRPGWNQHPGHKRRPWRWWPRRLWRKCRLCFSLHTQYPSCFLLRGARFVCGGFTLNRLRTANFKHRRLHLPFQRPHLIFTKHNKQSLSPSEPHIVTL